MQKFPDDSRDFIEKKYGKKILQLFPLYANFWEKFIGCDEARLPVLLPRIPKFHRGYEKSNIEAFKKNQLWIARANYGVFCNLASSYYLLKTYKEHVPIGSDENKLFLAIESIEDGYLHIGNLIYCLKDLWGKIRKFDVTIIQHSLFDYLETKGSEKNYASLLCEPKSFRDKLSHFGRNVFEIMDNQLYLPFQFPKEDIWIFSEVHEWVPAGVKLKDHIELACKSCNDVYKELISILSNFLEKEDIVIP